MLKGVSAKTPKPLLQSCSLAPAGWHEDTLPQELCLVQGTCRRWSPCLAQGTETFGAPLAPRCWLRKKASFTRKQFSALNETGEERARGFQSLQMPATKSVLVIQWFSSPPHSTLVWLFLAFSYNSFPLQIP